MTPKEKAQELVKKYKSVTTGIDYSISHNLNAVLTYVNENSKSELEPYWERLAIASAKIAVDEIIDVSIYKGDIQDEDVNYQLNEYDAEYWEEVKEELEELEKL